MRAINRGRASSPACLARFRHGENTWGDLTHEDRQALREALGVVQGQRCSYCECDLARESNDPHIEHFDQRSRVPQKTFDWTNLFWSCSHNERCGKYKDRQKYSPAELLKPDVDDPEEFLAFTEDGRVFPRKGLSAPGKRRAQTTIDTFNLNCDGLRGTRKAYLAAPYSDLLAAIDAFGSAEAQTYLAIVASDYDNCPFSAAVRSLLLG